MQIANLSYSFCAVLCKFQTEVEGPTITSVRQLDNIV